MSNYVHFNVKLAEILGLHSAIYLGQLMDINEKAIRKKKTDKDFFVIDRKYIESRTTLKAKEQKDIEKNLIKIGVLKRDKENEDALFLDITMLTTILANPDEEVIRNVKTQMKKTANQTKLEAMATSCKEMIITNDFTLRKAYFDWIDAVLLKDGFMTKQAVTAGQAALGAYQSLPEAQLRILEIATINAYRDMTWAVNNYKKEFQYGYQVSSTPSYTTNVAPPVSQSESTPVRKRLSSEVF